MVEDLGEKCSYLSQRAHILRHTVTSHMKPRHIQGVQFIRTSFVYEVYRYEEDLGDDLEPELFSRKKSGEVVVTAQQIDRAGIFFCSEYAFETKYNRYNRYRLQTMWYGTDDTGTDDTSTDDTSTKVLFFVVIYFVVSFFVVICFVVSFFVVYPSWLLVIFVVLNVSA